MTRPESASSPLRLRRNMPVSAKSAARAGTRHSGASAAEADLIMLSYVAAKAATHKHFRPSPNILLMVTGVGVAPVSRYATFHSTTKAGSTGMSLASRFDSDVTGEQVPIFAERGFLLGAKHSRPHCLSDAMRRSQKGGYWRAGSNFRRTGILAWRKTLSTTLSVRRDAS